MIGPFKGDYSWLSNMHPCKIPVNGNIYPCVEVPYQALKFPKSDPLREQILRCSNGYEAKKLAKTGVIDPSFHDRKLEVMRRLVEIKFQDPTLRAKLLATGSEEIAELNTWNDTFWGVDIRSGKGDNHLGRILMDLRSSLSES
jgi:ribA/ribD-fused uncharacterized protein